MQFSTSTQIHMLTASNCLKKRKVNVRLRLRPFPYLFLHSLARSYKNYVYNMPKTRFVNSLFEKSENTSARVWIGRPIDKINILPYYVYKCQK